MQKQGELRNRYSLLIIVAIKKFKDTDEDEIIRKNTQREVKMLRTLRH